MVTILFMPFLLVAIGVGIFTNGLLLKFSCWLFNRWFAGSQPEPEPIVEEPTPIATAMTADEYAASEAEQQANPFSSPRQAAKPPRVAGGRSRVVVPTIGVSLGLGFLLTGIQVVIPIAVSMLAPVVAPSVLRTAIPWNFAVVLLATFACTTGLVSVLLSNHSFRRGLAVTVVYYVSLIAFASPLIIAAVFFAYFVSGPVL